MDLLVNMNGDSEVALYEAEDDIDDMVLENDRCGICMDVVIDRGVLDCCDHWFCFACIDNWASITNLCPLCKNEFQLITCLPVYDTIGGISSEEHFLSRDDDWCIQGRNNTLSFPSYYIDEDAVTCLEGDSCKVRSGMSTSEDDFTVDTSIACDSCDIWYHAFCVGFNPEYTSENSWLCPRCTNDKLPRKAEDVSAKELGKKSEPRSTEVGWSIDSSFSEKVSVSVADAGETAIVVSMVEGMQMAEASKSSPSECMLDIITGKETEMSVLGANTSDAKHDLEVNKNVFIKHTHNGLICSDTGSNTGPLTIEDSFANSLDTSPHATISQDQKCSLLLPSLEVTPSEVTVTKHDQATSGDLKANSIVEGKWIEHCSIDEYMVFSPLSCDALEPNSELSNSLFNLSNSLSMASSPVKDLVDDTTKNYMVESGSMHPSEGSTLPVSGNQIKSGRSDNAIEEIHQNTSKVHHLMSEQTEKSSPNILSVDFVNSQTGKRERDLQVKTGIECPVKKARTEEKPQILPLKSQAHSSASGCTRNNFKTAEFSEDDDLRLVSKEKPVSLDIMSIVQETDHRSHSRSVGMKSSDKSIEEKDIAAGLRVKKILRRIGDNRGSFVLVQKLRKEIREAVQDKASNVSGRDDFNGELLTAFRAAILKPQTEMVNGFGPSCLKMRKSLLQKGKTRENLTKKIYATSTGRRRRAWDRDWEIEFWKHRCMKTKPERVETLQSVLELLKKASDSCSENSEMEHGPEGSTKNSILSRVYLADASVFPRKDDIKPLSALDGYSVNNSIKENGLNNLNKQCGKDSKQVFETNASKNSSGISKSSPQEKGASSDSTGKMLSAPSIIKKEALHTKGNSDGMLKRTTAGSVSSNSKENSQYSKDLAKNSSSTKIDKRKWALEILARKNAMGTTDAGKGTQEDTALLKGNYPLLAQLPADMRPVPGPSRHNKVPVSVRQTHLYRITEHYLRRTNLPAIRRTAETELAVADAVNIEKEIFERSNSKSVYINLCSQAVSQWKNEVQTAKELASDTTVATKGSDQIAEETFSNPAATSSSKVEEALRMAGLSDSPPNSPYRPKENPDNEVAGLVNGREGSLENVLDTDSYPELHIFGDFEYDTEQGLITSSSVLNALGEAKSQPEDGDTRIKVVLPTHKCEKSEAFLDHKSDVRRPQHSERETTDNCHDNLEILAAPSCASTLSESQKESSKGCKVSEVSISDPAVQEPSQAQLSEEPYLADSEDLYGPDKQPPVSTVYAGVAEATNCMGMDTADKCDVLGETEEHRSKEDGNMSEFETESCAENNCNGGRVHSTHEPSRGKSSPAHSLTSRNALKVGIADLNSNDSDLVQSISRKVEAYIKEHLRPLCKSGVVTVEQYRWAVTKTTDKVMRYHHKAKNASFLIKEGAKVKKLAEEYVEAAQQREWQ